MNSHVSHNRLYLLLLATISIAFFGVSLPAKADAPCKLGPRLFAPDGESFDRFGNAVAMSGDVIIVGECLDDTAGEGAGAAYVYEVSGGELVRAQKLIPSDASAHDVFGVSVGASGDWLIAGAELDDGKTGSAHVFHFNPLANEWVEEAKLVPSTAMPGDRFGHAVAIDGEVVLVAGMHANMMTGLVAAFRFDGAAWVEEAILSASDGDEEDHLGMSMAVSGNVALIGASHDADAGMESGSAYVFRYDPASGLWNEEAKLVASDASAESEFGFTTSISGDVAVVGAYHHELEGMGTGSVYVYRFNTEIGWTEEANLKSPIPNAMDGFGWSVATDGSRLLVGAFADDQVAEDAGIVYSYVFDGSAWLVQPALGAFDASPGDAFGYSIAISGDTVVVGTTAFDDFVPDVGAAYVLYGALSGDCNENGALDTCDLAGGASSDENGNGVPDECENTPSCEGDANGDGAVDPLDSGYVLARLGCPLNTGDPSCDASDVNADGLVDPLDVGFVLARFGECP